MSRRVQQHELEVMRRSLAMSPNLSADQVKRLIDSCAELLAERVRIERILAELGPVWGRARHALNELDHVLKQDRQ